MTQLLLAELPAAAQLVDHAAMQSDRWMFIAMLAIVLSGGVLIIRYLVKRDEAERERMHESYQQSMEVSKQLAITLASNTSAISANTKALDLANILHEKAAEVLRQAAAELKRLEG